jgi:thiol-activated cytolysin
MIGRIRYCSPLVCGLVAKFIQKNFTVDLDLPADGCLLKNNNELSNVGPYDPVYISSITYGRMGVMMFDSSYAYDSLRVAVKAAFDAKIINGKLELTSEQTKIISEADLKIAIISGDGSYSVKTVDGINGFKEFIIAGGEFSKDVPGDPIFYSASYLSDDSPFYAKFRVNIPYK